MDLYVNIQRVVVAKVLQHHTWHITFRAVASLHQKGIALQARQTGRVGVASKRKLVCVAAEPSVGNLSRTLMRRPRGKGETEQQSENEP